MTADGIPDEDIWDQASMGQGVRGDRRGAAGLQPLLNGSPLIGVPICCNDWVHHLGLHILQLPQLS